MQQGFRPPTTVSKTMEISAAHYLRDHPGKCRYAHGHNYKFVVSYTSTEVDDDGILLDFTQLKALMQESIGVWDHTFLVPLDAEMVDVVFHGDPNDPDTDVEKTLREMLLSAFGLVDITRIIPLGMPTTAENLAMIAARKIRDGLRELKFQSGVVTVLVSETCTSEASVSLFLI